MHWRRGSGNLNFCTDGADQLRSVIASHSCVKAFNRMLCTHVLRTYLVRAVCRFHLPRLINGIARLFFASVLILFLNAGITAQQDQSIKHWQTIVEQNPDDAKAWFNIGVFYETGQDLEKNQTRAYEAYKKSIDLGYAPAMYNLGSIYAKQKDYVNARQWWEMAAELGLPEAQYNMGMLYEKGWGVKVDPQVSSNWYQRAAETAMDKYFQLYRKSRSEHQTKPAINEASVSIVERLAIFKTASAASAQHSKLPAGRARPVDLQIAQANTAAKKGGEQDSVNAGQPSGWDWIYSQPQESFTIQLFATKDPGKTEKFIQQYALSARAQVIQAVVKDATYYKVLIGSFTDWNDAAVEIGTFPKDLRNQRPWVRKFGSLYKEVPETLASGINDNAEKQQAVNGVINSEKTGAADQNGQESTLARAQAPVQDNAVTENQQNNDQVNNELQPVSVTSDEETLAEKEGTAVSSEVPATVPVSEEQSGNDARKSLADSTPSRATQAETDVQNSENSQDMPLTDDLFTLYTKKQLASEQLSDELKTQLRSGLDAMHAGDQEKALMQLSDLAESGLPEAQYRVALLYAQGKGVKRDTARAFDLMKSASEQGHPFAQRSLAEFYKKGLGIDANPSLAAYWQQTSDDNLKKLQDN